jgi:hypothetical protein
VRSSLAARLPAGEAHSHYDHVDLVNDALDDVACDLGTVFLEDLRMRTDTLVGTRTSSVSSWRLTDSSGRARSWYESSR